MNSRLVEVEGKKVRRWKIEDRKTTKLRRISKNEKMIR